MQLHLKLEFVGMMCRWNTINQKKYNFSPLQDLIWNNKNTLEV